jgi:hypothetical protein
LSLQHCPSIGRGRMFWDKSLARRERVVRSTG